MACNKFSLIVASSIFFFFFTLPNQGETCLFSILIAKPTGNSENYTVEGKRF